jgi:hypothetical protein
VTWSTLHTFVLSNEDNNRKKETSRFNQPLFSWMNHKRVLQTEQTNWVIKRIYCSLHFITSFWGRRVMAIFYVLLLFLVIIFIVVLSTRILRVSGIMIFLTFLLVITYNLCVWWWWLCCQSSNLEGSIFWPCTWGTPPDLLIS